MPESTDNWRITQLSNRNYLSPIGFKFIVTKVPKADFFSNSASIPGINLGFAQQPTYLRDIPVPGDKISYQDFTLKFFVDENLENYLEVHNWLRGLGYPDSIAEFGQLKNEDKYIQDPSGRSPYNEYSDASLLIYNSSFNVIAKVNFRDTFPVGLSQINFDATQDDIKYVTAEATFKYSIYDIETFVEVPQLERVQTTTKIPTVTLTSTASGDLDPTDNFSLQYTSSNVSSLSINQSVGSVAVGSGSVPMNGTVEANKATNIDSLTSSITYTITAVGTNGTTVTAQHTITFIRPQTSVNRVCIAVIDESQGDTFREMENRWTTFRANWPDRHFYLLQPSSKTTGGMYDTSIINDLKIPPSFLEQTDPDSTTVDTEPSD